MKYILLTALYLVFATILAVSTVAQQRDGRGVEHLSLIQKTQDVPPPPNDGCESESYGCPPGRSYDHRPPQDTTVPIPHPGHPPAGYATTPSANIEARSLAQMDGMLYLGTSAGAIFASNDGGQTWQGFAAFRGDYVIDRMLVTPDYFFVGAWTVGDPSQGSFFVGERKSCDGHGWRGCERKWTLTLNKPVRAIGLSGGTLIVGTPDGVYRSEDYGMTFEPISHGIKDVQSVAVDPENPSYIFIGTWHLGWYTHSGGATWHQIARGIINDSDFFSIVLDGSTIYIGACSGIYKGSDDGEQYRKEKTKTEARRTKVIRQVNKSLLYAGTTDGVWVTTDGGKDWKRRGNRNIVVNDMVATSASHLVVATSRFGVIWSDDGGKSFTTSQF